MLTVLVGLLVCGAGTVAGDPTVTQANAHQVSFGIGAFHFTFGLFRFDTDVFDYTTLGIIEAAQERSSTE